MMNDKFMTITVMIVIMSAIVYFKLDNLFISCRGGLDMIDHKNRFCGVF